MKTATAIFASLVLVLVLIGFGSSHEASADTRGDCVTAYNDANFATDVCKIPIDAKHEVTCVAMMAGYGIGVSCDWDHMTKG